MKLFIYNFIHTILIKTINNDNFKQSVETTVLVHAWQHINEFSTNIYSFKSGDECIV